MELIRQVLRGILCAVIVIMVYIYGCSGPQVTEKFTPLLKQFEKDIGVSTDGVRIYFADLKEPKVGTCYMGTRVIHIDRNIWDSISEISRKALIYHELGHCVCKIFLHTEDAKYGCDGSLMSKTMESPRCYIENWDKYIKDLRLRCQ